MSSPVVAVAGGTGRMGKGVVKALLSSKFRPNFKEVVVLSRTESSGLLVSWASQGATIRTYSEDNLAEVLKDVNIVINVVGSGGYDFKDALLLAISQSPSIDVYFPSEFGVDHGDRSDPDFDHPEWNRKKSGMAKAKEILSPNVKVCRVFPGLFTEMSVGPWFGMDTANKKYEAVGSADAKCSYTFMDDIGRSVAALASLPKGKIPDEVRIAGDSVSMRDIAKLMVDASGEKIEVVEIDEEEYKTEVKKDPGKSPGKFLRFLIGNRKLDFSKTNANELINKGESVWKWKTMKDYAEETKGRPWID